MYPPEPNTLETEQAQIDELSATSEYLEPAFDPEAGVIEPLGYCEGADLVFTEIRLQVACRTGGTVEIIKGVSGACRSGRLLAVMGASGARSRSTTWDTLLFESKLSPDCTAWRASVVCSRWVQ